ncbi:MAG: class I SAM-dependent methyltransferase [Methanothrix sp.]|nr:class I SAM-dependent methyltransferase [Methanothrix sp.]
MPGIINWNELWKATHAGGFHHHGKDLAAHWDSRARLFNKRVMKNREWAKSQVAILGLTPSETVLDMGAGTGRLALPLARQAKSVTALDQSAGMLACLQENMAAEGIGNIRCIQKSWNDVSLDELEPHDVVLSSNSLGVYDLKEALTKMDALAKRAVYIFTFSDGKRDDGLRQFLRENRDGESTDGKRGSWHGRSEIGPASYLVIYNLLAEMGILADIKMMNWQSDVHYASLDEAVAEWKEMHEVPDEKDQQLREFLSQRMTKDGSGLCMHRSHRQVLISWQKGGSSPA